MVTEADIAVLKEITVACMQDLCKFKKIPANLYQFRDDPQRFLRIDNNYSYLVFFLEQITRQYVSADKKERLLNLLFKQQRKILINYINALNNSFNSQQIDNPTTRAHVSAFANRLVQLKTQLMQQPINAEQISMVSNQLLQLTAQHIDQTERTNQSNAIRVALGFSKTRQYLQRLKNKLPVLTEVHRFNSVAKSCTAIPLNATDINAQRLPIPFTDADIMFLHSINLQCMQAICQQHNQQIPAINYEFRDAKSNHYTVAFLEKHLNSLEKQSQQKYPMIRAKLYTAKILQYIQKNIDIVDFVLKQRMKEVDRRLLQELQTQLIQIKNEYTYNEQINMDRRHYFTRLSYIICLSKSAPLMNNNSHTAVLNSVITKLQDNLNDMRRELFNLQLNQEETYFCIDEQNRHQVNQMVDRYRSVVNQRQQLQQHSVVTSSMFHHNELSELNKKIAQTIVAAVNREGIIAKEEKAGLIMHLEQLQNNIDEKRATYTNTSSLWKGYGAFTSLMLEVSGQTYGAGLIIALPLVVAGLVFCTCATVGIHAAGPGKGRLLMSIGETRDKLVEELNNDIWHKPNAVSNSSQYTILEAR